MHAKVTVTPRVIAARDGAPLASSLYAPSDGEIDRVVIVTGAVGVRQSFYEPFARFLAANKCAAVTFDFRGIGASLKEPIAKANATIRDWGEKDYAAVIDFVADEFPGKPLQIVGNSVGGQLVGILDNVQKIRAVCTVAAQHGYFRLYPWRQALSYGFLWYFMMPLVTWLLSYFPAKRLRLGEDLPRGVAFEWARFCRSPYYMTTPDGAPMRRGFEAFEGPVLAYSMEDDVRAPENCVRALHAYYTKANVEYRSVSPSALKAKSIGHVGFFFSKFKGSLWQESLAWLREH